MLRDGSAIGSVTVGRARPGHFSDAQIELLRAFADQAVIAIENVPLFTELQTSIHELTAALGCTAPRHAEGARSFSSNAHVAVSGRSSPRDVGEMGMFSTSRPARSHLACRS
jgi:GAF domain-containing protein